MATTYADTVIETLDVPLVLAIDRGETLASSSPWRHEKIIGDVMHSRMLDTLANDTAGRFRSEHLFAVDFTNFSAREVYAYDAPERAMFMALYDIYLEKRAAAWPEAAQRAFAEHTESMLAEYVVQWEDNVPHTETEMKRAFDRLYHRYETYMRLADAGPAVPAEDIWIPFAASFDPATPTSFVPTSFEAALWSRYPPEMQMIESVCRSPKLYTDKLLIALRAPLYEPPLCNMFPAGSAPLLFPLGVSAIAPTSKPEPKPVPAPPKPAANRVRGGVSKPDFSAHARGTGWLAASTKTTGAERNAMLRALRLPAVAKALSSEAIQAIAECLGEVTVEYRHRAQNQVKGERTHANTKRANAPVFRYEHPAITKDVINQVVARTKKTPNVAPDARVPTRALCFACFLHLYNVPSEAWPPGNSFPRPV